MNKLTQIQSTWVWNGKAFRVKSPDVSALQAAWREVLDAIDRGRANGMHVDKVVYHNDCNEVTPCNVDRNIAFFRVFFTKDGE